MLYLLLDDKNIAFAIVFEKPIEDIKHIEIETEEEALKYLQPDKDGVIPFNVYDPKFVDVYLKIFIHPLDILGIDFFWLDVDDKNFLKKKLQNVDKENLLHQEKYKKYLPKKY